MSGFSFPPPPPPPPKLNSSNGQITPQRGGRGHARGRGDRGSFQQRGRSQSSGRARGGQSHYSHQQDRGQNVDTHGTHNQLGVQSRTHHGISTTHQRPGSSTERPTAGSPQRTIAGHKRKLDALRGPPQKKPEKKSAPATAPSVPTFGAPIFPAQAQIANSKPPSSPNGQNKQKPPARRLGLTPGDGDPQYSSSESDNDGPEIDEEAMYAELGDKLTFEHNGVVMSLSSQADLVAWKNDRQKNWPTKARMITKDEEKRKVGEERRRLLAQAGTLYPTTSPFARPGSNIWKATNMEVQLADQDLEQDSAPESEPASPITSLEKARRDLEEKTKRLDELRKRVLQSEARNRKAREVIEQSQSQPDDDSTASLPTDGLARTEDPFAVTENEAAATNEVGDSLLPAYASDSDSNSPSESSSDDDDDESSDDPPEEITSRPIAEDLDATIKPGPRPPCRYLLTRGFCRNGDACHFSHNVKPGKESDRPQSRQGDQQMRGHVRKDERAPRLDQKSEGSKKTIFQRLVEQEEEEDNRLALKAVKYLGGMGFFRL